MAPTPAQMSSAARQWQSTDKDRFMFTMYHKMFAAHPEWKDLFKKFSSPVSDSDPAFKKQVELTKNAFDKFMTMAAASQTDALVSDLHTMARRHVNYNVGQNEFQALKPILMDTVSDCVSGADKTAWSETVGFVLDNIVVD